MAESQINSVDVNQTPIALLSHLNSGKHSIAHVQVSDTGTPIDFNAFLTAQNAFLAALVGAETTITPASVTLTANTAATLLAANGSRIRALIHNPLASPLFVRKATLAGSAATTSPGGYDFVIPPGGQWFSDVREWAGAFNGICASAGNINVSQSV